MQPIKRLFKNKKGIDTILAALLMVVIVVVASVMVYAWSTGLLGSLLITPTAGKEALNMDTYAFNSNNMIVTINIRNTGSATVSLGTYYVKDTAGNTYSQTSWTGGPIIAPNAVNATNVPINTSCTGCTYSGAGTGFTFSAGSSY